MKKFIIIGLLHLSLCACGQSLRNEKNLFHHSKIENLQLGKTEVYYKIDTLLSLNGKNVFAISDTTKSDSVLIYYNKNENHNYLIGSFRTINVNAFEFKIDSYSESSELIGMKYTDYEQGLSETSLTFFIVNNTELRQILEPIFEVDFSNSGICPDMEKCYEFKTDYVLINLKKIKLVKVGTILKKSKMKKIHEVSSLELIDDKWIYNKTK